MHNDLEDIMRIANCSKKKCSREDALFVLEKVCSLTKDESRRNKNIEFQENKELLVDRFQEVLGQVAISCKQGLCEQCTISKWCNAYRIREQKKELKRKGLTYADFFLRSRWLIARIP